MSKKIIIGSRGSDLALWQARHLQTLLTQSGEKPEIKIIKTQGDLIQNISLEKLEGKGFFTKEIEDALLRNEIDIAVHSHKDLPTENTKGLIIAAVSKREDASEFLLMRKDCVDETKEFQLKKNAIVGTSSSRRAVQLKFFREDLQCKDIRGNIPTRLEKLRRGDFDAILLAFAGVKRLQLNIDDLAAVKIPVYKIIPAPAQGILAYQCRENDELIISLLKKLNHPAAQKEISVERKVMNLFNGGCHIPLGVYCTRINKKYHTWASQSDSENPALKRMYIATENIQQIAETIFEKLNSTTSKSVFITSNMHVDEPAYKLLTGKGFSVNAKSLIKFIKIDADKIPSCNWVFFTSKNGVKYFFEQPHSLPAYTKIAAIGHATAQAIRSYNFKVDFTGEDEGTSKIISKFIQIAQGTTILLPQALYAQPDIEKQLAAHTKIIRLPVYKNEILPAQKIPFSDIVVFTSPLNADAYMTLNKIEKSQKIIAIGNTTKQHLEKKGYKNVLIPYRPELLHVADFICGLTEQ